MQSKKCCLVALVCCMLMTLTACHSRYSGSAYSGRDTRQAQSVEWGVIESVDYVTIEDRNSGAGAVGGAFAGGAIGSLMGRGHRAHVAGMVVGSLAGAAIGYGLEEAANTSQALEYTVRLDSGELIAVVQAPDEYEAPVSEGEEVRVLTSPDGTTRIRR